MNISKTIFILRTGTKTEGFCSLRTSVRLSERALFPWVKMAVLRPGISSCLPIKGFIVKLSIFQGI